MKQPALYILCGLPFAGKTTLASELVCTLGFSRVSAEDFLGELGVDDDTYLQSGLSAEVWAAAYNEAYRHIDALLRQGKSVVDDSANFTRDLRDRLRAIADKHGAPTTVVYVDVPLSEARWRWQENRQAAVRGDVRDDDFALVTANFEPPTADENVVCYDGSIPLDAWIDQIFAAADQRRLDNHKQDRHP